jgi:hypothetical protein
MFDIFYVLTKKHRLQSNKGYNITSLFILTILTYNQKGIEL